MNAVAPLLDVGPSEAVPSERHENDFYPTPREVVEAIVPMLPFGERVLDIGCGDGAILDVFASMGCETFGIEIDADRAELARSKVHDHEIHVADVVTMPIPRWATILRLIESAHLIVMNPPFSLAEQFMRLALNSMNTRATLAALLRVSFGDTIDRVPFHIEYPNIDTYTIPNRIDFTRGAVRICPKCDGSGKQSARNTKLKPSSKIDPYRCEKCIGHGHLKGGNDSAAVAWWVAGPGRAGRRFTLDEVRVAPPIDNSPF